MMKTIKVSKEVHEELSNRKYGGETFDDVLKRELELIPITIDELTAVLPEKLSTATQLTIKNHVNNETRYKRIGRRDDNKLSLRYIEQNSNKVIFEVSIYLPAPPDRINHRVDIRYRTPQNELERIAQLRDTEDNAVNITEIKSFDTHKVTENTRKGGDAGRTAANEVIGPEAAQFVEQAYNFWGDDEE
jgi:predicted CopG family antitoxin